MALNLNQIKVDDKVAVAKHGSWSIQNQGICTVVKANKMHVVVQHDSDRHERTFSAKTGQQLKTGELYPSILESVEDQMRRKEADARRLMVRQLWLDAEKAVQHNNISELEFLIAQLKTVA